MRTQVQEWRRGYNGWMLVDGDLIPKCQQLSQIVKVCRGKSINEFYNTHVFPDKNPNSIPPDGSCILVVVNISDDGEITGGYFAFS